eukprot:TRINITY_DN9475_c0_g1_i1.p1 TRINITY_DN9475_c0_g1~~TRINITY_DN9475_c0_g1_i1.p1  ORF type:complete len:204 (+),score=8.73 TRINITY_DN9475_c0_g1_i1:57-668(+)
MKHDLNSNLVWTLRLIFWTFNAVAIYFFFELSFGHKLERLWLAKSFQEIGTILIAPMNFLTVWNHFFQLFYFSLCLITSKGTYNAIRGFFDMLFAINFSVSLGVVILFWILYGMNPEFLMPADLVKRFEQTEMKFLNYEQHLGVGLFMFFEMIIGRHHLKARRDIPAIFAFSGTYLAYICFLKFSGKDWPYPFMSLITPSGLL